VDGIIVLFDPSIDGGAEVAGVTGGKGGMSDGPFGG